MNRIVSLTLAFFLAISALAHSFGGGYIFDELQSTIDLVECSSNVTAAMRGSDTVPLSEDTESKKSVHCQMHYAIFAELVAPPITSETREHAAFWKTASLSNVGYVVPRPPNAHG